MNYPTSDRIDPGEAKYLYEHHCAILILENLPPGSEFGIDLVAYRTGEKFKGIKLVPPGIHFVYVSSVDKNNHQTLGPRCGFVHNFREKEILLKKWSAEEENFDDAARPDDYEDSIERYSHNLRDLDPYLGPYNFSTFQDYKNLTNRLTVQLVGELLPDCQRLASVPYLTQQSDTVSGDNKGGMIPRASLNPPKPSEDTIVPDLKPDPKTVIHFTKIPTNHLNSERKVDPDQITFYNLDTTLKMDHCFPDAKARQRLLAEFQFAFVTFLLYHIYESFEHWKRILTLICLADSALSKLSSEFFSGFISIVRCQIKHIPEDLFEDIVDSNNLVRNHMDILLQNIENHPDIDEALRGSALDLKKLLVEKFGWKFGLIDDEDQPVVVEM